VRKLADGLLQERSYEMLDQIRALFRNRLPASGAPAPDAGTSGPSDVHLAACALLLDLAWADGEFSEAEVSHLQDVLARHFGLDEAAARELIQLADAERRRAIDHFSFTRVLKSQYDIGQRVVLAEVMWGLVLSDGRIAEHEHYLARKIANLLDLEPAYLANAKRAAAARLEGDVG